MPEGPESYSIVEGLQFLVGSSLIKITSGAYISYTHMTLTKLISIGKRPTFVFDQIGPGCPTLYLMCFLGMTGRFLLEPKNYTRASLTFIKKGEELVLYYDDQRKLGYLEFLTSIPAKGFDLLASEPSPQDWASKVRSFKPDTYICDLLLDDRFTITIGNYLKSDILYVSKIHPLTQIKDLDDHQIEQLRINSLEISRKSFKLKGHSFRDFLLPDGTQGRYIPICYGQTQDPEGRLITSEINGKTKRRTYWCPAALLSSSLVSQE